MCPKMDIKDIIRRVYSAIMIRSCYLGARGEVRNTDAGQIRRCSLAVFKKGETNVFLHSLNFNHYVIALRICQISFFLLLGLDLKQESGDMLLKGMSAYVCICKALLAGIYYDLCPKALIVDYEKCSV